MFIIVDKYLSRQVKSPPRESIPYATEINKNKAEMLGLVDGCFSKKAV